MKSKRPQKKTEKPLQCIICSTETDLKTFEKDNDFVFHHMTHSITELSNALLDIQKLLRSMQIFEKFPVIAKTKEEPKEDNFSEDFSDQDNNFESEEIGKNVKQKFDCKVCGKTLSNRGNLNKHMVQHDPSKKFQCDICQAKFNQKRDLKNHNMNKHTGERPYVCKECGKGFVHKHYLNEHMDYHTGDRKYQCPQCGKRFTSASSLSKHSERHKGLRNHHCPQCPKSFLVSGDLRHHVRLVHEKAGNTGIPMFPNNYSAKNTEEWMISQNSSINLPQGQQLESLTLTNMENHSHTMLVLPSTSNDIR